MHFIICNLINTVDLVVIYTGLRKVFIVFRRSGRRALAHSEEMMHEHDRAMIGAAFVTLTNKKVPTSTETSICKQVMSNSEMIQDTNNLLG